jgi:RNA polymerase sigma-70 factor (sigma-E family)
MGTADDFEAWYRSERTNLLRFAFLLCGGDRHAAEDAVADAVARSWPKIRRGRVDDSGAYVRRAIARRVIDGGRRRQVAARHRDTLEQEAGRAAAASEVDTLAHLVLWPVVEALPTDQRVVVVLRFYLDWSEAQIAEELGIAPGTVKSRCARALDRLRTELAEVNDG